MSSLTRPAEHLCPSCETYNRAKDNFGQPVLLMPECPVCVDKRRRGEPIEPEPFSA